MRPHPSPPSPKERETKELRSYISLKIENIMI